MKKSIIMAVMGAAGLAVSSSYGQGVIIFDTYNGHYLGGSIPPVSYLEGGVVPDGVISAELYYALGTVTDPVDSIGGSIISPISASFTAIPISITLVGNGGYIQDGAPVQIANYTSGAISFEIGLSGAGFAGRSGAWTESSIGLLGQPDNTIGDNGAGPGQLLVAPVPEPTTLALAGLGGLASLMALRRKQA